MLAHLEYFEYCIAKNLSIEAKKLNTDTIYYWHSTWESKVIPVKFIKLNGNTFIFEMEKGKIGLSMEHDLIYGLSYQDGNNTFEHWKFL